MRGVGLWTTRRIATKRDTTQRFTTNCDKLVAATAGLPLRFVRPEIFRLDDEVSHEHRTADTVEMPLAGSIFCQADVASAKNFFGATGAAHLDLQLAGRDDSDLIDDTRMKIHPPVFPAQHTETRDPSRRAPLVACVRKQFGELGNVGPVVLARIDPLDVGRRLLARVDRARRLNLGLGSRPIGRHADLQEPTLVADIEGHTGRAPFVREKDVPGPQLRGLRRSGNQRHIARNHEAQQRSWLTREPLEPAIGQHDRTQKVRGQGIEGVAPRQLPLRLLAIAIGARLALAVRRRQRQRGDVQRSVLVCSHTNRFHRLSPPVIFQSLFPSTTSHPARGTVPGAAVLPILEIASDFWTSQFPGVGPGARWSRTVSPLTNDRRSATLAHVTIHMPKQTDIRAASADMWVKSAN